MISMLKLLTQWIKRTWCQRRLRRYFYTFGLGLIVIIGVSFYLNHLWLNMEIYYNPDDASFNYFQEIEHYSKAGLIINTQNCQIPNVSAWDKAVLPHLLHIPPVECSQGRPAWTYANGTSLILNTTALVESGYAVNSVSCCFKTITRVAQSLENYDVDADDLFVYSDECEQMTEVTEMKSTQEFVKVFCISKYWPFYSNVVYKNFHAFVMPNKNSNTRAKTLAWKSKPRLSEIPPDFERPPNVLVLGIDSVSRLSFERHMKRLREHLLKIRAVELKGYTKVGENTFPNTVAFLTGYYEEDLQLFCYPNRWKHQDNCPYIWKRFGDAKYWTAMAEDVPHVTAFNFWKTGFIKTPVDFYLRPFMLAVYTSVVKPLQQMLTKCIGEEPVARRLMKYVADLIQMSSKEATPIFAHGWTNVAHDDFNAAQLVDDIFSDFFETVDLTNTIIFFLSDHGYRFGAFRPTFPGWLEDKLPNSWVYLPPALRLKFPKWFDSLLLNSERLTTPFDVYHTMNHIIDTFTQNTPNEIDDVTADGEIVPRRFGQSLFTEVPFSRTCEEAGVPNNYCACVIPKKLSVSDPLVKSAADAAVKHLNSILPPQCSATKLKAITAAAMLVKTSHPIAPNGEELIGKKWRVYIVAIVTSPGDFVFEVNVDYIYDDDAESSTGFGVDDPSRDNFKVTTEVLRMNKINTDVSCVTDGLLERICYCK